MPTSEQDFPQGGYQIRQIRLEIWPEPDLSGFPKNGWIPDLTKPVKIQ